MSTNRRWYWAVIWHNPYTLPPDGYSRLMLVVEGERGQCPDEIEQLYTALRARHGGGWSVTTWCEATQSRRWTDEQRYARRRLNLRRRLERRYPMFAEQLYVEALTERPEYYGIANKR